MVQRARKKTLFFISLILGSVVGLIGSHLAKSGFSRDFSLLLPQAYADATSWWGGDGDCGGCSAGDSAGGDCAGDY